MKMNLWVLPVIMFLLMMGPGQKAVWAGSSAQNPDFEQIDAYVQLEMERAAIPGLAYGIVSNDQVVHLKAFGVADPSGRPVTPQTPFVIGSVGKTFTALAITQLEAAGTVNLDVPIRRYLPWFSTADSRGAATVLAMDPVDQITLRHLRNHTSGLSQADGRNAAFLDERYTLEELVRKIKMVHLNRPVGSKEEYSNLNFLVLGLVIQVVSGQTFEAYVQQHILDPLEMRHTYLAKSPAIQDGLATGYHIWYGLPVPMLAPFPTGAVAQGYVISTAEDMAHYLSAYIHYGNYNGLSLTTGRAPQEPQDDRFWYDIYWQPRHDRGNVADGQSGGTQNYNAFLMEAFSVQNQNYGVVVLLNSRPDYLVQTVSAQSLAEGINAILYGNPVYSPAGLARFTWFATYMLIDLVFAGLVTYCILSILRLVRWLKTTRRPMAGSFLWAALDLLVGGVAFGLPPLIFKFSWLEPALTWIEIGILALPAGLLLCMAGLIRLRSLFWVGMASVIGFR